MALSNHRSKNTIEDKKQRMPEAVGTAAIAKSSKNILRFANKENKNHIIETPEIIELKEQIRSGIVEDMVAIGQTAEEEIVREKVASEVAEQTNGMLSRDVQLQITKEIFDSIMKLGPLQPLMEDPRISDILVNRDGEQVFVDRGGMLYLTDIKIDREECRRLVDKIASRAGRHVDESHPALDCTLRDGSRVNITLPPMAIDGISISIRRFPEKPLRMQDLVAGKTLNKNMAKFLQIAVEGRNSIVISGGTGSGKTTLLNVLSNFIPDEERIITIEDAAELKILKPNLVRLEARDANNEGKGEITIRDCVVDTLRMRPDRIIVGECRQDEVVDMLQAMNTGHDGSLTTVHANSVSDCLVRLETMFLMAGIEIPVAAIRRQIVSAVNLIVQIERDKTGQRRITEIAEITGMEKDTISRNTIFKYDQETGKHIATGVSPRTVADQCERSGLILNANLFTPPTPTVTTGQRR